MPLKDVKYKFNQTIIKVYGFGDKKKIKFINMKTLRNAGVEDDSIPNYVRGTVNDEKLSESISRAKAKIFEIAFCNSWDFFFTATLDQSKYDRADLEKFHKALTQWFRDYKKKFGCKIDFLLVPELHSDGKSWHMHGLLKGIPIEHLQQFKIGDIMGKAIADKVCRGDIVFNWKAYQKKFGFCDLEPIVNHEAVAKYLTKYINKNLASCVKELNAHLFYHSRGLKTAVTMKKGTYVGDDIAPSFISDYCSTTWLDYSDETLDYLLENIIK